MELTSDVKEAIASAASLLKGGVLRRFKADIVRKLGYGGQRLAERELNWERKTIRKGEHELRTGIECVDGRVGNKRACIEDKLPNLTSDIKDIVDIWSQTDPRFKTTARYTRLTVSAVVERLMQDKGYQSRELPSNETIRRLMHRLGFRLRKVQKSLPKKKSRRLTRSSTSSTRGPLRRANCPAHCASAWTRKRP